MTLQTHLWHKTESQHKYFPKIYQLLHFWSAGHRWGVIFFIIYLSEAFIITPTVRSVHVPPILSLVTSKDPTKDLCYDTSFMPSTKISVEKTVMPITFLSQNPLLFETIHPRSSPYICSSDSICDELSGLTYAVLIV